MREGEEGPQISQIHTDWKRREGTTEDTERMRENEAQVMMVDVSSMFERRLARNRGPIPGDPDHRQPPNYGIVAHFDGETIFLTLTFHAGSAYCCFQYGCHLDYRESRRWDFLRKELVALGSVVPERLKLQTTTVVEAGALFFDWSRGDPSRRGWYEFAPHDAGRCEEDFTEGEVGSPEADFRPGKPTPS